jgi:hypothetical protein
MFNAQFSRRWLQTQWHQFCKGKVKIFLIQKSCLIEEFKNIEIADLSEIDKSSFHILPDVPDIYFFNVVIMHN